MVRRGCDGARRGGVGDGVGVDSNLIEVSRMGSGGRDGGGAFLGIEACDRGGRGTKGGVFGGAVVATPFRGFGNFIAV